MSRKQETARQAYIRNLESEVERVAQFDHQDLQITAELVDAKYLNGDNLVDHGGTVRNVALLGMTVEGRLFLQKLRAEEKADSPVGILKKHGSFVTGAFVGALIPFCLECLDHGFRGDIREKNDSSAGLTGNETRRVRHRQIAQRR